MKSSCLLDPILHFTPTKLELGAVYTPSVLSNWVASLLDSYNTNANKKILDPASGDGALLEPLSRICINHLVATDINETELLKITESIKNNVSLHRLDTLKPTKDDRTLDFWKDFFLKEDIGAVISNPPWGSKIWQSSQSLRSNGLNLASGQYDAYELFIELMINAASNNTYFAFIIPDSIFLSEHKKLRKLILEKCKIHVISRLGEGFFDSVNRGTCVIILEKAIASESHFVKCMRLNKKWRTNILLKNISFQEAFDTLSHSVKQSRFLQNDELLFDIDILETVTSVQKIDSVSKIDWSKYFKSGRGVEIAKSGKVLICDNCGKACSVPRKKNHSLCICKHETKVSEESVIKIIDEEYTENSMPLIVGEDIKRNTCSAKRYIKKGIKGINYKSKEDFSCKKLLIRKTGIGVKASIDNSGAYTNQVVFHYIAKNETHVPSFMTEYVLGVLSSRVLMAYYLQKYGDNEWRSHPYITQKVIAQLPIPDITKNKKLWNIAKKIASLINEQYTGSKNDIFELDLKIERYVVKLFSLTENDCRWIVDTLNNAQQLEPIRNLAIDDYKILLDEHNEL